MFSICKQFLKVNDALFLVVKTYQEDRVVNVDGVKHWLDCDIVFRKDGNYYFCQTIQELETIEE